MRMKRERLAPIAAIFVVMAIVTMSAPVAVDAALIANWTMDDAVGSTVAEDSAGTYDASLAHLTNAAFPPTGTVTFGVTGANGNTGTAAQFYGDDAFLQADYNAALNPATFTVALWAKNAWTLATNKGILSNWNPGGFFIKQDWVTGWAFFSRDDDNATEKLGTNSVDNTPLTTDWTHVAITYDGTTKRIYLDGTLAAEALGTIAPNTTRDLLIGQMASINNTSQGFVGLIDDIGLWDTILSQAEIQTVMTYGVQGDEVVPEPSTFILAGFGLLGLGLVGRRKRRR